MKALTPLRRSTDVRRAIRRSLTRTAVVLLAWATAAGTIQFAVVRDDDRSLLLFLSAVAGVLTLMALVPTDRVPDAVWGAARYRQRARLRSLQLGQCPRCGYDLRSSPEHCPECGHQRPPPEYAERLHKALGPRIED